MGGDKNLPFLKEFSFSNPTRGELFLEVALQSGAVESARFLATEFKVGEGGLARYAFRKGSHAVLLYFFDLYLIHPLEGFQAACQFGDINLMKRVIEGPGGDLLVPADWCSLTVVRSGNIAAFEWYESKGLKIATSGQLFRAACSSNLEMAKFIHHKYNCLVENTCFEVAFERRKLDIFSWLFPLDPAGAETISEQTWKKCYDLHLPFVRAIVDLIHPPPSAFSDILAYAAKQVDLPLLKFLIAYGVPPDPTAAESAISSGSLMCLRLLVEEAAAPLTPKCIEISLNWGFHKILEFLFLTEVQRRVLWRVTS